MSEPPIRIVAMGGTTRPGSSSQRALAHAAQAARAIGAEVDELYAEDLELPVYAPERPFPAQANRLVELLGGCDGVLIASPGFHGGPSGLIKNALDYAEELRQAPRPYLDGRAVGVIVVASGWQATATTLVSLRSTVHALRAWPTPLGVAINSQRLDEQALDPVDAAQPQLALVAGQVIEFARARRALAAAADRP
jgi:FMN reductase